MNAIHWISHKIINHDKKYLEIIMTAIKFCKCAVMVHCLIPLKEYTRMSIVSLIPVHRHVCINRCFLAAYNNITICNINSEF